jgi:hypothetical protein
MDWYKVPRTVTPAKAGVYKLLKLMDPGFRRDDAKRRFWTFRESINIRLDAMSVEQFHY